MSVCGGGVNTVLWYVNVLFTKFCVSFSFVICVHLEYVCAAALRFFVYFTDTPNINTD